MSVPGSSACCASFACCGSGRWRMKVKGSRGCQETLILFEGPWKVLEREGALKGLKGFRMPVNIFTCCCTVSNDPSRSKALFMCSEGLHRVWCGVGRLSEGFAGQAEAAALVNERPAVAPAEKVLFGGVALSTFSFLWEAFVPKQEVLRSIFP